VLAQSQHRWISSSNLRPLLICSIQGVCVYRTQLTQRAGRQYAKINGRNCSVCPPVTLYDLSLRTENTSCKRFYQQTLNAVSSTKPLEHYFYSTLQRTSTGLSLVFYIRLIISIRYNKKLLTYELCTESTLALQNGKSARSFYFVSLWLMSGCLPSEIFECETKWYALFLNIVENYCNL